MQEIDPDIRVSANGACPVCQSRLDAGDVFCGRCGVFLHGDNASPEALNLPVVHLLTQVCTLQKDLLRQFRTSQALQARQFQRALEVQVQQLEKTLAHAAREAESQERRLNLLVRWSAGLASATALFVFLTIQLL
jgi:hypothetical protein